MLRIGTSGWNYRHWRDIFYPHGLKQKQWLAYLAASFDTVEINASFYRLPKPEYVDNWRREVPEGFLFAVKGSRYLTHLKRLLDTGESLDRFFDVMEHLEDKAGPVLWQLPPRFERDEDRLASFVSALPGGWRHTFEFRHPSWFCQEVYDVLDSAGAALCIPVHPDAPREIVLTAGWTYIRFHYGADGGRFTSHQLGWWKKRIRGFLDAGNDAYVYFNNDWEGYALQNAAELKRMLESGSGS